MPHTHFNRPIFSTLYLILLIFINLLLLLLDFSLLGAKDISPSPTSETLSSCSGCCHRYILVLVAPLVVGVQALMRSAGCILEHLRFPIFKSCYTSLCPWRYIYLRRSSSCLSVKSEMSSILGLRAQTGFWISNPQAYVLPTTSTFC